jgi:hypothetical protein
MSRLPDRFDLLVRKVRDESYSPERQMDFLLAAFFALQEAHLINAGDATQPRPSFVELDQLILMPVFSSADQADTYTSERGQRQDHDPLGLLSMRPASLLEYAQAFKDYGCQHWIINPGPYGFILSLEEVEAYQLERKKSASSPNVGFWIPNMTSEEEAFWEDHGL